MKGRPIKKKKTQSERSDSLRGEAKTGGCLHGCLQGVGGIVPGTVIQLWSISTDVSRPRVHSTGQRRSVHEAEMTQSKAGANTEQRRGAVSGKVPEKFVSAQPVSSSGMGLVPGVQPAPLSCAMGAGLHACLTQNVCGGNAGHLV